MFYFLKNLIQSRKRPKKGFVRKNNDFAQKHRSPTYSFPLTYLVLQSLQHPALIGSTSSSSLVRAASTDESSSSPPSASDTIAVDRRVHFESGSRSRRSLVTNRGKTYGEKLVCHLKKNQRRRNCTLQVSGVCSETSVDFLKTITIV